MAEEAFMKACCGNSLDEVRAMLAQNPELVKCRDKCDRTPLLCAVHYKYTEIVMVLLEKGADPNARDCLGFSALIYASLTNNTDAILLLLGHGADPNIIQDGCSSPLDLAIEGDDIIAARALAAAGAVFSEHDLADASEIFGAEVTAELCAASTNARQRTAAGTSATAVPVSAVSVEP